ncbi:MAG: chromosome segregation protein SMC [Anaerolineaceae bacterium]|nr:chromosome segregation protein SMC [Anaerolineaceae bacterium]
MPARLKSLELQGYKTFASRTLFEFAGSVTAIVGPNGSGKSNVADSMRWVLGEQSFSLLRGRKTEDMIFAGSEKRPRASMASATIVFDNEDGWLPIDYSEVSIARRAYRDGQNEYLLNGQKVRLKEINELLGQSGLAERTYTVIGQGLVDAALALRPEERRSFFEEAAGIQLYRRRRQESLNRLDATRRNMDRVLDILSEIKPRLRSLERQAKRAEEYEQVNADLQLLLRDWYGYHWHRSQKELTEAREVYESRNQHLLRTRADQSLLEEKINQKRAELQRLREQLNEWHTQSSTYHRERERISKSLAVMDERNRSLLEQQGNYQSDLNRLEEERAALKERLEGYRAERDHMRTEQTEAQEKVVAARRQLQERQAERNEVEEALRKIRQSLTKNETDQVRFNARKNELDARVRSLHENMRGIEELLQKEEAAESSARRIFDDLTSDLDQAEEDVAQMDAELSGHRERVKELEESLRKVRRDRSEIEVQISRLQAQLGVLEQAEKSFSGLNQGSKVLLQSAKAGRIRGQYAALSAMMDVPAEYEAAVAAVLGEYLDAVILADGTELDEALTVLEKGENGRTVLVPISGVKVVNSALEYVVSDFVGRASDLVKIPAEGKSVAELLLSNAYIVESRESARRLVSELPNHACAVTLAGEIFRADGVVIAAHEDGRSGVISRPRQKRELQEQIKQEQNALEQLTTQIDSLEKKAKAMEATERQLEGDFRRFQAERSSIEKSRRQVELEYQQAQQRREFQVGQQQRVAQQIEQTERELIQLDGRVKELEGSIEQSQQALKEERRRLNELPLEELQNEEAHWNTNLAVANRALSDAEQRMKDYDQEYQNAERQYHSLQERIRHHGEVIESLSDEQKTLHTAEISINSEIQTLQDMIDPAEANLERLDQEYVSTQDDYSAAQQLTTSADRSRTQASLDLSRQREHLDQLRSKIEEDFGLVAFEFEGTVAGQETLPFEGIVEQLPNIDELPADLEDAIRRNRAQIRRIGAINPDAMNEFIEVQERHEFLSQQLADLEEADENLRQVIAELDELMKLEFRKTFDAVAIEFKEMFTRLFGGGSARLILTDEDHPTETGIEIEARLPGRREQGLALLSGGERSLTAVALVFSLLKVSPTPFCILDEVDAMLDESNVGRFCDLLTELSKDTQFIVITHNRGTVQASDVIYGVTKGSDSASQIISLKLDEISEEMVH